MQHFPLLAYCQIWNWTCKLQWYNRNILQCCSLGRFKCIHDAVPIWCPGCCSTCSACIEAHCLSQAQLMRTNSRVVHFQVRTLSAFLPKSLLYFTALLNGNATCDTICKTTFLISFGCRSATHAVIMLVGNEWHEVFSFRFCAFHQIQHFPFLGLRSNTKLNMHISMVQQKYITVLQSR